MNAKKHITLLLLPLLFTADLWAQETNVSLYQYTPLITNPGALGVNEDALLILNYRNQSVEAGRNFQTSMVSGFYAIKVLNNQFGMGATFISDQSSDLIKTSGGIFAIAHGVSIFEGSKLSLGIQGGYFRKKIGFDFTTHNQFVGGVFNPNADTGEGAINDSRDYFTLSSGLYWDWKDLNGEEKAFAGISLYNFNRPNISFAENGSHQLSADIKGMAGFRVYANNQLSIVPNIYYWHSHNDDIANIGSWFRYKLNSANNEKVEVALGTWYKTNKEGVIAFEYKLSNLSGGVSYDFPWGSEIYQVQNRGVIEFSLLFRLNKIDQLQSIFGKDKEGQ